MRRLISLLAFVAAAAASPIAAEAAPARPSTFSAEQIRTLLRDKVDRDRRAVGMIVGVVDENGALIFSHGRCCTARPGAIGGDTVFEIGSLTKPITQALLSDMVARGEVGLSDPISRYLPAGTRVPTVDGREMTLQHLAEHTSGLPRMPDDYPAQGDDYSIAQLYAFLGRYRPTRAPGAQREYSNVGYGLLAHLLSRRAGMSYAELVRTRIAQPLGMTRTFVGMPPARSGLTLAQGHDLDLAPQPPATLGPVVEGAGAVRSTMNDLLRFLSASMGLGGGLVPAWGRRQDVRGKTLILHDGSTPGFAAYMGWDPERRRGVVVLANSNHLPSDVALHLLQPAYPLVPRRVRTALPRDLLESYAGRYGSGPDALNLFRYGARLFLERANQPPREVFAEAPGRLFLDDARPIAVETQGGAPALRIFQRDGASMVAARSGPAAVRFQELDSAALGAIAGTYEISPGLAVSVTVRGAAVFAQVTGQGALEIVPVGASRFRYLDVPVEIEFVRDAAGSVTGLVIHEGADATRARRVAGELRL